MKRAFRGKTIYDRESPAGWAVVVMPDHILIDSYHGESHVHTNPADRARDRKIPIRPQGQEEVLRIVQCHIEANRGIDRPRLLRELGVGP